MKRNYKKIVLSAGLAAMLALMPVTAFAGTVRNDYKQVSNISFNNIGGIMNKVDVSAFKNNTKVSGANIVLDKDSSDWENIKKRSSAIKKVSLWKAAIASDYSALYIYYEGTASSEWDYNYMGQNDPDLSVRIEYADGTDNETSRIYFTGWKDDVAVKNAYSGNISNANMVTLNEAHQNTEGPYMVEASIPMDFFANEDFKLTFAGTTIDISDVEVLDGNDNNDNEEKETVYNGITIDGKYHDWDAVTKYAASCPNDQHKSCLESTAMVFDGDYVYIYIKDGNSGIASGAGSHSNGRYSIKTDLGNELQFQLKDDGSINGIDDAECIHIGKQWEIAIPKSDLPAYNKSLSFGLYLTEPFISDVVNIKEDREEQDTNYDIEYDGNYADWEKYPHTTIQYATAGTHHNMVDAKGALFCSGSTLYGHVVTNMPEHLQEAGGEFTQAVTIRFNGDDEQVFYPRMETVGSDGSINWDSVKDGLSDGPHEFYLFSIDAWHNSANINSANEFDQYYGKMIVTIKDGKQDECEFYLDLEKVAEKLGCDASDFKQIEAQFKRIGTQWLTTAGASSGAWLGLILCVGVTAGVLVYEKKKGSKQVSE